MLDTVAKPEILTQGQPVFIYVYTAYAYILKKH